MPFSGDRHAAEGHWQVARFRIRITATGKAFLLPIQQGDAGAGHFRMAFGVIRKAVNGGRRVRGSSVGQGIPNPRKGKLLEVLRIDRCEIGHAVVQQGERDAGVDDATESRLCLARPIP